MSVIDASHKTSRLCKRASKQILILKLIDKSVRIGGDLNWKKNWREQAKKTFMASILACKGTSCSGSVFRPSSVCLSFCLIDGGESRLKGANQKGSRFERHFSNIIRLFVWQIVRPAEIEPNFHGAKVWLLSGRTLTIVRATERDYSLTEKSNRKIRQANWLGDDGFCLKSTIVW